MKKRLNQLVFTLVTLSLLLFLLVNIPPKIAWNDEVKDNQVSASTPVRPTGSSGSYMINVKAGAVTANPAVYWNQLDDLSFEATKDGGKVKSNHNGDNTPKETQVNNTIDLTQYNLPANFMSDSGQLFSRAALTKMYLKNDSVNFKASVDSFKGVSLTKHSDTKFTFVTKTGSPNRPTDKKQYGKNKKGQPKYTVRYDTPVDIAWYGEVLMQAEVRVVEDSKMVIGQKKNFKLQLRTKEGALPWTNWNDTAAATWASDKSSVASVSSSGQVTAKEKGQAKISATWIKDNYHLIASASVTVTAEDALSVTGTLNACFKDGSTKLKAKLYKAGGTSSDVTSTATWTSSDTSVATVSKGIVTFKKAGSTTIKVTSNGKIESVKVTIIDCTLVPLPTPTDPSEPEPPTPPFNEPPTVKIEGETEVIVGETVCYKANAEDSDGVIELYEWDEELNIFNSAIKDQNTICGKFENVGEEHLIVKVRDNGNEYGEDKKWAYTVKIVTVVAPKPNAYVIMGGLFKENRRMTAQPYDPYNGNALAHQKVPIIKQTLKIEAVEKSKSHLVKVDGDISDNIDQTQLIQFLAKFSGQVKVTRYVENSAGANDTFETIIDVAPDLLPIVDFDTATLLYREPAKKTEEYAEANIVLQNSSYSIDGDFLNYFVYTMSFDSSNDGTFKDSFTIKSGDYQQNKYYTIANATGTYQLKFKIDDEYNLEVITPFVGKYRFELEGWECFGNSCSKYPIKK